MANPRKFSEKIALHNQKQAEETAAFERIMREVSDATSKVVTQSKKNLTPASHLGTFRGGSLPNVSEQNKKQQTTFAQIVDATNNTGKKPDENTLLQFGAQNTTNDGTHKNSSSQNTTPYRESRGRSVGVGPMRRPGDRKIDTSPYSSGNIAYLSPPSDSNWRRTSSDSAIHQSLMQSQDNHHSHGSHSPIPTSPVAQRRITNTSSNIDIKSFANDHSNSFVLSLSDNRPRSSCGLPRLPGINIYPSAHDNTVQIPIANNTGSLPDLTSVHFPSPLHTPLDQDHDHSSSPYSSSPVTTSPATLSPTSIPTRHPTARFPYSPVNSPGEAVSPTHGTSQSNTVETNSYQTSQSGPNYGAVAQQQSPRQQQQQQQAQQQQANVYNQQIQQSPPNNVLHGSQSNLASLTQSNLSGYRSPGRPSPGSSPGLVAMPNNSDSNTSAPCSPASQPLGNNGQYDQFQTTEYYLNPSIQQHFEQFSLDWAALVNTLVESGCTWTAQVQVDNPLTDYSASSPLAQTYSSYDDGGFIPALDSMQSNQMQISSSMGLSNPNINLNSTTMANDTNNHVSQSNSAHLQQTLHSPTSPQHQPSPQSQQQASNSQHQQMTQNAQTQHGPQTPNTPTSIPEIIFTDFSGTGELTKDLFDQPIELELGAMDFAGFQMLSDPNATMIADPTIEDSFRRDLN